MIDVPANDGDCFFKLANENGFYWETVWKHARNSGVNQLRKDPFTLKPTDPVHIPDITPGTDAAATAKVHRYRRHGAKAKLRVVLQDHHGQPFVSLAYALDVNGIKLNGTTTGTGMVEQWIDPTATSGTLAFDAPGYGLQIVTLSLGSLEPIGEDTGVQTRLQNLGYYTGPIDGKASSGLTGALQNFQVRAGLPPTGKLDPTTRDQLFQRHDA